MRPQALALSPNGKLLATADKTRDLVIIDPDAAAVVQRLPLSSETRETPQEPVSPRIFNPDRKDQIRYTGLPQHGFQDRGVKRQEEIAKTIGARRPALEAVPRSDRRVLSAGPLGDGFVAPRPGQAGGQVDDGDRIVGWLKAAPVLEPLGHQPVVLDLAGLRAVGSDGSNPPRRA